MRIAVIGTGRMGRGFGAALCDVHDVVLGSRDPDRGASLAARLGVGIDLPSAAAEGADVVVLTVPWPSALDAVGALGDLGGTVLVDVSYAHNEEQRAALKGRSTAEVIARRSPGARVVKAWNHVHAAHLTDPAVDGVASSVLVAGDDEDAKQVVSGLARDMGFHPVDVGPLRRARDLERLVATMTFVQLGRFRVLDR